jgi:uncharacterized SAM-binding protein YcdF (DUF218 family)
MVILSKLLNLLAQPLNGVLVLLAIALLVGSRKPRLARSLVTGGLALLALTGVTALPDALIHRLENQSPEVAANANLRGYAGMVVLGGGLASGRVSAHFQQALLNSSSERMTGAVAAWRLNPQLRVVFTGGEGELFGKGPSEGQRAQRFFSAMGLPPGALVIEDKSQNTFENAVFTAKLPGIDPQQRWLLVTSAWHMPRSLAVFQKAGWNVTPYPVDFRTTPEWTPLTSYSLRDGADHWELLLHEWIGIAAYRLTGRM